MRTIQTHTACIAQVFCHEGCAAQNKYGIRMVKQPGPLVHFLRKLTAHPTGSASFSISKCVPCWPVMRVCLVWSINSLQTSLPTCIFVRISPPSKSAIFQGWASIVNKLLVKYLQACNNVVLYYDGKLWTSAAVCRYLQRYETNAIYSCIRRAQEIDLHYWPLLTIWRIHVGVSTKLVEQVTPKISALHHNANSRDP